MKIYFSRQSVYQLAIFILFSIKIILLILFLVVDFTLSGGNDSDYYHAYAIGEASEAVNLWPVLLRELHNLGLYSREHISWILKITALFIAPFLLSSLSQTNTKNFKLGVFWINALLFSCYATIVYLSLDIYRDIAMLLLFIAGLFIIKKNSLRGYSFYSILLIFSISILLYELRHYLGFSLFIALLASFIVSKIKIRLSFFKSLKYQK